MDHIRVLITAMPALHADIIKRVMREQPDMEIVGEAASIRSISEVIEHAQPDVVLVTTGATDFIGAAMPLVLDHPRVRVVAVDTERNGSFAEARQTEWLTKAWPENLGDAIRRARVCRGAVPPSVTDQ